MGEHGKHTPIPTPWRYQENSDAYTHIIRGPAGEFICSTPQDSSGESEANARLIVHRVNTWEGLREALTEARAWLGFAGTNYADNDKHSNRIEVVAQIEAALRAAGRE